MINFPRTIDSKDFYKRDKDSPEIIDFLAPDYVYPAGGQPPKGIDLFMVSKNEVMRGDLVAVEMYGFIDPLERVFKFNDVSNPLSINEGDIFVVWDLPSTSANMRSVNNASTRRQDVRDQYITPEKKSTVDPRYQAYSKRNQAPKPDPTKGNTPALPPNLANYGDQEIELREGKLILGPNVTKTGQDVEQPMSKSDFIANIIKNRVKAKTLSTASSAAAPTTISDTLKAAREAAKKSKPTATRIEMTAASQIAESGSNLKTID